MLKKNNISDLTNNIRILNVYTVALFNAVKPNGYIIEHFY